MSFPYHGLDQIGSDPKTASCILNINVVKPDPVACQITKISGLGTQKRITNNSLIQFHAQGNGIVVSYLFRQDLRVANFDGLEKFQIESLFLIIAVLSGQTNPQFHYGRPITN